jgi:hypothetical protein
MLKLLPGARCLSGLKGPESEKKGLGARKGPIAKDKGRKATEKDMQT